MLDAIRPVRTIRISRSWRHSPAKPVLLFARCLQDPASLARMPTRKRWWRFPPIVTSVFIVLSQHECGSKCHQSGGFVPETPIAAWNQSPALMTKAGDSINAKM